MVDMNVLGGNYLLRNTTGVADPATKYLMSTSEEDVQKRLHSDGQLFQMNDGKAGTVDTFVSGHGNALFATDEGDTVNLKGNWTNTHQYVHDVKSDIWGELWQDDQKDANGNPEYVIISGKATVNPVKGDACSGS